MSAYLVSEGHINYIVNFIASRNGGSSALPYVCRALSIAERANPDETLTLIGQALWDANQLSLNARYSDEAANDAPVYRYVDRYDLPIKPVEVLSALRCYDYQACEINDYSNSPAAQAIDICRREAIRRLPGMDAAAWGAPAAWDEPPKSRYVRIA